MLDYFSKLVIYKEIRSIGCCPCLIQGHKNRGLMDMKRMSLFLGWVT